MANQAGVKKPVFIIVAILALIAGGLIGYFIGQATENQTATAKYMPIINAGFPAPSGTLHNLTGQVTNVYGATITLTVNDPSDYLPHLDGLPQATQSRNANVTSATKYFSVDNTKPNPDGSPTRTAITLASIKAGDTVVVQSAQNIFSASTFDVTEVDLVK